jgi:hypothetical protein
MIGSSEAAHPDARAGTASKTFDGRRYDFGLNEDAGVEGRPPSRWPRPAGRPGNRRSLLAFHP